MEKIRPKIYGVLNKVTLMSVPTVCAPLLRYYTDGAGEVSTHDVTQSIGACIVESLTTNANVRLRGAMVLPHCVLCKAVQMTVGNHHAAYILRSACDALRRLLQEGSNGEELTNNGLHNIAMYLAMLYAMRFIDAVFISSLCQFLSGEIQKEHYSDVLLTIMHHSGEALRRDDATVVQDVLRSVQRWSDDAADSAITARHAALLDFLRELRFFHKRKKGQTQSFVAGAAEMTQARAALSTLCPGTSDGRDTVLSVTWLQCVGATDARWWLPAIPAYQLMKDTDEMPGVLQSQEQQPKPEAASSNHQINTPLRKQVWGLFVKESLLTTQSVLERICQLDPKEAHAYEIAFVMLRVLCAPGVAPMITDDSAIIGVTHRLCNSRRDFRHNMQIVVIRYWEMLSQQALHLQTLVATARWCSILAYHQRTVHRRTTVMSKVPDRLGKKGSTKQVYFMLFVSSLLLMCPSDKDALDCFVTVAPHEGLSKFLLENFVNSEQYEVVLPVIVSCEKVAMCSTQVRQKACLVQQLLSN